MTEAETFIKDCIGFRATGAGSQTFLSLRSKDSSVRHAKAISGMR